MQVEVVRSTRRRKTVELRPTPDGVRISIPAHATKAEEEKYVRQLLSRYKRRQHSDGIDLMQRAAQLSQRYGLEQVQSIKWVENQNSRWGSCTPSTSTIRISGSVAKFPSWVLDYVIIRELAHLSIIDHNADFWALVNRYEKTERARGFLIAKSTDTGTPTADSNQPQQYLDDEAADDVDNAMDKALPVAAATDEVFDVRDQSAQQLFFTDEEDQSSSWSASS